MTPTKTMLDNLEKVRLARMNDYERLIDRLKKLDDFCRDLDRDIGFLVCGWRLNEHPIHGRMIVTDEGEFTDSPGGCYPAITEDMGAAIEWVERLFPGAEWQLDGHQKRANGHEFGFVIMGVGKPLLPPLRGRGGCYGGGANAAIAIWGAILLALSISGNK